MADSENAYLFSVNFYGGYNLRFNLRYHSVRAKVYERASVLLCDPTHYSIVLLTTTIFCCTCSAHPHRVFVTVIILSVN